MAEETLLTAARRMVRFYQIDEAHGGLMSIETMGAMHTLSIQVEKESKRQKLLEDARIAAETAAASETERTMEAD
jgi:DNA-binding protein YbaB